MRTVNTDDAVVVMEALKKSKIEWPDDVRFDPLITSWAGILDVDATFLSDVIQDTMVNGLPAGADDHCRDVYEDPDLDLLAPEASVRRRNDHPSGRRRH